MSVLDTPRIYFRGQMTWDPIVTNNYPQFYDLATSKPTLGAGTATDYRERARQAVTRGNWNPHGTHRSTFFETTVTGVDAGGGPRADDALVGVPISFTGKLVDLDPYGATTSQLFFDELSCGIDGGPEIVALGSAPMAARRINFARNRGYTYVAGRASVMWQASFAAGSGVSVRPHGSAVLAGIQDLLGHDDIVGLTVRFNAYRTVYYDTEAPTSQQEQGLADQIAEGGFHPNPARSLVVGVIGLWREGEPPSVPGDRVLARVADSPVWTAFARVVDGRLAIDLSNSVPETGFDVTKLDLGPLGVFAKAPDGDVALGTLDYAAYDTAAYEATSGIVTLPLEPTQAAAADTSDLELRSADGSAVLTEQPLTVTADPPNVYLEEGEQTSVSLRTFLRGRPPDAPVSVTMVELGGPLPPVQLRTDEHGHGAVSISGGRPGSWTWVLVPWDGTPPRLPTALDTALSEYVVLRTTPADADVAALEPTWHNVYHHVLRDWEAQAPCMDNWLRLGDEQQCRAYARLVRDLTSRERFDHYGYMPVTRELTQGQRILLHRWCDAVTGESTTSRTVAAAEPRPARDPFGRGL